jgi:probable F420-dependent oxidoreductase
MNLGLIGIGSGVCVDPVVAKRVAQRAEALGYDSLWTGEHVVYPEPREEPSNADPDFPILHPSTSLAFIAGVTERVLLGTGIALIAQRNPIVLAKEMASLNVVSQGRLVLGIGAGYVHQEFAALGVNFKERGARTDECVAVMRALWNDDHPAYNGRFVRFSGVQARPRPIQPGGPPIVIGGDSEAAMRRAAAYGQGWYGFGLDIDETATVIERLKAAGGEHLEINITSRIGLTDETVTAFSKLGVHRLILVAPQLPEDPMFGRIEAMAPFAR